MSIGGGDAAGAKPMQRAEVEDVLVVESAHIGGGVRSFFEGYYRHTTGNGHAAVIRTWAVNTSAVKGNDQWSGTDEEIVPVSYAAEARNERQRAIEVVTEKLDGWRVRCARLAALATEEAEFEKKVGLWR
jgi:hypothetical protein